MFVLRNSRPKKIVEKLTCMKCKKEKAKENNYYNSNSKMFDGKTPICKACIKSMIDYDDMDTVYDTLQQLDIGFHYEYWNIAEGSKYDTLGKYITMSNSLSQLKGFTWKDSVFENTKISQTKEEVDKISTDSFTVTEKIIEKFGEGYTPEEYRQFEKKYNKLINNYGEKTALHTEGLLSYIRFRVKEEMATASGNVKEAKEWGAMASKAAQDAKINVSQLSKSDISGGVDVLSQLFEAVETEASVLPLLPKLLEQPYDDADLIIWANINYYRKLEDKPFAAYRDIWDFYDEMLYEYFDAKGFNEDEIKNAKEKRNNVFRDLANVYVEPLYDDGEDDV